MARTARYDKIEMVTDEEKHLLKRIEEMEELVDRIQTICTDHKHEGDRVVIDATWAL